MIADKIKKEYKTASITAVILIFSMVCGYFVCPQTVYGENEGTFTEETSGGDWEETEEPLEPSVEEPVYEPIDEPVTEEIDTRLSSLTIACGELDPGFSPDQYTYTVYVHKDAKNKDCRTEVETMDPNAEVKAEGPKEFSDEDVKKKVIVTGADGSISEYIIDVHLLKDNEKLVKGKLYTIAEKIDIKSLPGSFKETEIEFNGQKIKAAVSSDENLCLVAFVSTEDENEFRWYIFDQAEGTFYPVKITEKNGEKYILILEDRELVYGGQGEKTGYYILDPKTGELTGLMGNNDEEKSESSLQGYALTIVAMIVAVLSLISLMLMYRKYKRQMKVEQGNKYFRPYLGLESEEDK